MCILAKWQMKVEKWEQCVIQLEWKSGKNKLDRVGEWRVVVGRMCIVDEKAKQEKV